MEDILARLGVLESSLGDTRNDVSAIKSVLPHLASKADVDKLEAELRSAEGSVKAEMNAMETRLIKWFIVTATALTALAFTIARFVV